MNSFVKEDVVKQPTKKRPNIFETSISNFFGSTIPFKNNKPQQKEFLEYLTLLIIKNYLPMSFVESIWLERIVMHLCPRLLFPYIK